MAREIRGTSSTGTLYARIINSAGLWANGSSFEAYSTSNYSLYVNTMAEQGNSGVYVADFPSWITAGGTYEYFVHRQTGGSPAEGDPVINTGKIDWTGIAAISAATGAMSGSEWRDYVLRLGFKRTDKDAELFEATTDAIQEMRRRCMFDEAEIDSTTTDTISVLGDFKLDIESDLGLVLGIVVEDDDTGIPLIKISKGEFDCLYSSINVDNDHGFPKHYSIYAGKIYIGPSPDQVSYRYRINYSQRAGTITSSTAGVPFTNLYRDVLADNVQMRLYRMLEEFDKANLYKLSFEDGFLYAIRRERKNSGEGSFQMQGFYL